MHRSTRGRVTQARLEDTIARGAMPPASICGLKTGFDMTFSDGTTMPWLIPDWPHVGATAWFIFASRGDNPYQLKPRTTP
jgi:hypothetical protein